MDDHYDQVQTVLGTMMIPPEENRIGRWLEADGSPPTRTPELRWLRTWTRRGSTAVDVGACLGFFTLGLAWLVGPKGRVVAIEPNMEMATAMAATIRLHDLKDRCTLVGYTAMGLTEGVGRLREDPRGPGGNQVVEVDAPKFPMMNSEIRIHTLDGFYKGFIKPPVSVIKIDAEGADVPIMLGGLELIAAERPAILFEWNPEKMAVLGYDPWKMRHAIAAVEFAGRYHPAKPLSGASVWFTTGESVDLVLEPIPS